MGQHHLLCFYPHHVIHFALHYISTTPPTCAAAKVFYSTSSMKITNFATAFSLVSVAIGAALDSTALTPGVAIHANGAPVAQSLSITAEPVTSAKRDVEK